MLGCLDRTQEQSVWLFAGVTFMHLQKKVRTRHPLTISLRASFTAKFNIRTGLIFEETHYIKHA